MPTRPTPDGDFKRRKREPIIPKKQARVRRTLTEDDKIFIKANQHVLDDDEMATILKVQSHSIEAFRATLVPEEKKVSRISKMMGRPANGVTVLTDAAATISDDIRNKAIITQAEINQAANNKDYKKAAELLKQKMAQQNRG